MVKGTAASNCQTRHYIKNSSALAQAVLLLLKDGPASPASPEIPEYEKQRRAIMARNQEKMRELGLQQLAAEIMPKQMPKPRTQAKGLTSKKKVPLAFEPPPRPWPLPLY